MVKTLGQHQGMITAVILRRRWSSGQSGRPALPEGGVATVAEQVGFSPTRPSFSSVVRKVGQVPSPTPMILMSGRLPIIAGDGEAGFPCGPWWRAGDGVPADSGIRAVPPPTTYNIGCTISPTFIALAG